MGYHTDFEGEFQITPSLSVTHKQYLLEFSEIRHMKRDASLVEGIADPIREAVGLPVGEEGAYFLAGQDPHGIKFNDPSVLSNGSPPTGQPGLWCLWSPSSDGKLLIWNEAENFYHYIEWLKYLKDHFFNPWGYSLNGEVEWWGEDLYDYGVIRVVNNEVIVIKGVIVDDPRSGKRRLQVFLAHADEDKDPARTLYSNLRSDGISPWLDERDLIPGQDWEFEIEKALQGSDAVLILLSANSVKKTGYFQKEIRHALDYADRQPEGAIYVIPVLLEKCSVPKVLEKWHWVRLFQENGYRNLLDALRVRAVEISGSR